MGCNIFLNTHPAKPYLCNGAKSIYWHLGLDSHYLIGQGVKFQNDHEGGGSGDPILWTASHCIGVAGFWRLESGLADFVVLADYGCTAVALASVAPA